MKALFLFLLFFMISASSAITMSSDLTPPMPELYSNLELPVRIPLKYLDTLLNNVIPNELYASEDGEYPSIKILKSGGITFELDSSTIIYKIPVTADIGLDSFLGQASGSANIIMSFRTEYSIDSSWNLVTNTALTDFDWIDKPKLVVGSFDMSVKALGNLIISQSKNYMAEQIDEQLKTAFDLKTNIQNFWNLMHINSEVKESVFLSVLPVWLKIKPLGIDRNELISHLSLGISVKVQNKPSAHILPLPRFNFQEKFNEISNIRIVAEITPAYIDSLLKKNIVGEIYNYKKKDFKIEDVEFIARGGLLNINLLVSGSYEGNVLLSGVPIYDNRKNLVRLDNVKYVIQTKNFGAKLFEKLFRKRIKRNIIETAQFSLDDSELTLNNMLQAKLQELPLPYGMKIKGKLEKSILDFDSENSDLLIIELKAKGQFTIEVSPNKASSTVFQD